MISALTKPVQEIKKADLDELVEHRWPESENVEYKGELSRDGENPQDPWYAGGNVSDVSKKKIFKELVAFANTSGGRLFVGIAETREKPPRAQSLQPVPRCGELAERLEQAVINSIDPPLTFFRVVGVPTDDGDSGVLVAEVSASYSGPHRSSDLKCYVRKGTNSVPVGMREVHDMVMRFSRRQDEIRQRLLDRQEQFRNWFNLRVLNVKTGVRITAIPVGAPLYLDPVFKNLEVSKDLKDIGGKWVLNPPNSQTDHFPVPLAGGLSERPVLGGTMWSADWDERAAQQFIFRDGLVDAWFKWPWKDSNKPRLFLAWVVALAANVLLRVYSFRNAAQAPTCEYGIQIEIISSNGGSFTFVQLLMGSELPRELGERFQTPVTLGPYPIGDREGVMNLIVRDLLDASGTPLNLGRLEIDWAG